MSVPLGGSDRAPVLRIPLISADDPAIPRHSPALPHAPPHARAPAGGRGPTGQLLSYLWEDQTTRHALINHMVCRHLFHLTAENRRH